ncbi:MAG: SMEK domain-containing protein [Lachnospiraceae bacterium]|nr:SMEK domain-containing protein [Lachnospiraceae bacterium]
MNRSEYFNYIEKKLNILSYRIKNRGKINLLDLNIYSETFFADLMSHLLGYNLKNINQIKQNTEGIDLIDENNKIIAQVSSTCTKQKIENSLAKEIFQVYPDFNFNFIAIVGDADQLRTKAFKNPHKISFNPLSDIYDINSLLNIILNLDISKQRKLYEFIKNELGSDIDIVKVDSNLATIINILSQENFSNIVDSPEINPFEILRKIEFNDLLSVQPTIDDYKIFYSKLDEKYKEFDKQGTNKSISVLSIIRSQYIKLAGKISDSQELFFSIIDNIIELIKNSKNYIEIPYEELEMCVSVLVVDAFIRCKIFKNPEGYNYVVTR